jgi:uncharacterized protein YjbI with pentapeptide repeats
MSGNKSLKRWISLSWVSDIRAELANPSGWKLMGQMVAGLTAVGILLSGLMTYYAANLKGERDAGEQSYQELVRDLASDSDRIRVGSIPRIPDVMTLRVPLSYDVNFWDLMKLPFGGGVATLPLFKSDIQRLIRLQLHSLGPPSMSTRSDTQALMDMLIKLGPEGWYRGEHRPSMANPRDGLAWIWKAPDGPVDEQQNSTTLFENVWLNEIDLQLFDLQHADFKRANLQKAEFSYSNLRSASFDYATLAGADLAHADLRNAELNHANMEKADLTEAKLSSTQLKQSNLRSVESHFSDFSHAAFLAADLSYAHLIHCNLSDAYMESTTLTGADLSEANLDHANLSFSDLRNTRLHGARLTSANLRLAILSNANMSEAILNGVNFELADLRNVDFSNAEGMASVMNWLDANVAGVRGIDAANLATLVSKGAVIIPSNNGWEAYRSAGRPHDRWRDFARSAGKSTEAEKRTW